MSYPKPLISTSFSYETLEETLDIKPKGAELHIGIPREVAFQENRIALTPDAVSVDFVGKPGDARRVRRRRARRCARDDRRRLLERRAQRLSL